MFNLGSMEDSELRELINAANEEQEKRRRLGKERAWRNLRNALDEYLEWDEIQVGGFGDEVFIVKGSYNSEDMGIIRLDY